MKPQRLIPIPMAALLLAAGACGTTDPKGLDGSHQFHDGMVLDASGLDGGLADAEPTPPRCDDGEDNDNDGLVDYPEDPGCTSAEDEDESNPPYCGLDGEGEMIPLRTLPPTGHLVQSTDHGASHYAGSCGGDGAKELIFQLEVQGNTEGIVISTVSDESPSITQIDTVLYVRRGDCTDPAAELTCGAAGAGEGGTEVALENPTPGTYFIFVDGVSPSDPGQFLLTVRGLIPLGAPCDPSDLTLVCAPGIICDAPQPGDPTVCMVPYCNDGLDNDGDGIIDFPQEPGCETALDNSEEDTCPGAGCPQCADGVDNDGDGLTDWPDDPGCIGAGDLIELDECVAGLQLTELPPSGQDSGGLTQGDPSYVSGTCSTGIGPEVVYPLSLPYGAEQLEVTATTLNYNYLSLYLREASCADGTELACASGWNLPQTLRAEGLDPGDYYLFVDADDLYGSDTYDVSVSVFLPVGAPCELGSNLKQCAPGGLCHDVGGGAYECEPTVCNDGTDNDHDGYIDFPNDPGCDDVADNDEADSCDPVGNPGSCPACFNGLDDDSDGLIDYPNDPGCRAASDTIEIDECVPGLEVTDVPQSGSSSGTLVDTEPSLTQSSCGPSPSGPEDVYALDLPYGAVAVDVSMTSQNWTYVNLYARQDDCATGPEIRCDSPNDATSSLHLANLAPGTYYIFADAEVPWSPDTYTITFGVQLPVGAPCEVGHPLKGCGPGSTCQDVGAGVYQCVGSACNNGLDDDADGHIDWPWDPGCTDVTDNDEADSCATVPASCPACFDGQDNDSDGLADFPDDPGCQSAADTSEADECLAGVPFDDVTLTGVGSGSAPSGLSAVQGSCGGSGYDEDVYLVRLPSAASQVAIQSTVPLNVYGEAEIETVLYARHGRCDQSADEVGCHYGEWDSATNQLTLMNVPEGHLYVFVDADYIDNPSATYDLTVTATLTSGGTCIPAASGVVCPGGTSCQDPGAGYVCQ